MIARAYAVVLSVLLLAALSRSAMAQAKVGREPPAPSDVDVARDWSRASILGDLRELRTGSDYLELRVWGGFTLRMGTQGVVLRRNAGRWSALLARVIRCESQIPISVGDTASRETMRRYIAETRRHCGVPVANVAPGTQIITSDSVLVDQLDVPDSLIQSAWRAAERAGVFDVPPRVERRQPLDDPFTYVVELRRGDEYRASAIEHVDSDETDADRQVKAVYAAVNRVLSPELILKP
jgi:hypothetical protein